jgi:uncharacterized protein (UPF0548 family)
VEHREDDTVVLTIRAFSRPARWWSRAAGPVARLVQRAVTERYLRALSSSPELIGCRQRGTALNSRC